MFQNIRQKSNVLVLIGSFRECFQASIVLGHPAAPVLPKSRFDISETHEDLAFDTQVCRKLKLKVKIYRLPSQKWWLSCIWWKQVMGNVGQDDFDWEKNEKWFSLGVRWRKHSWTRDHRSALAFAPKTSAITTKQVSFVGVVMTITTIIIYNHQSINLILKSFFAAISSNPESGVQCSEVLVKVIWMCNCFNNIALKLRGQLMLTAMASTWLQTAR